MEADKYTIGVGFDRETGSLIVGWEHVVQSIRVIFTTPYGERIRREWFGSLVPAMLGRNITPEMLLRFYVTIGAALEAWEPRFRIVKFRPTDLTREGSLRIDIEGEYMPRAHLRDYTVEGPRRLAVEGTARGFGVGEA